MIEFQRTTLELTRQFLDTQRRVMLAYLGQADAGSSAAEPLSAPAIDILPLALSDASAACARPSSEPQSSPPAARGGYQPDPAVAAGNGDSRAAAARPADDVLVPPGAGAADLRAPEAPREESARASDLSVDELITALTDIISERTGYPADMLDPSLDLEADLGIDSIKRVEILSNFRKLLPDERQKALEGGIERLAGVKTIQGISDWIRSELGGNGSAQDTAPAPAASLEISGSEGSLELLSLLEDDAAKSEGGEEDAPPVVALGARLAGAAVTSLQPGETEFVVSVDRKTDLYLNDHTFDGIPVMPMAVVIELMLEAASSLYPGWNAHALTGMQIPAGIVFEGQSKDLIIKTRALSRTAEVIRLEVAVLTAGAIRRTHFKATAELSRSQQQYPGRLPELLPVEFQPPAFLDELPCPPTAAEVYERIMFHGRLFQGITSVTGMGLNGIAGEVVPQPLQALIANASGQEWIVDPALLDGSMQLAGIWARHYLGITVLPAGFDAVRRLAKPAGQRYRAIVAVPPETEGLELKCDMAVYGEDGRMVLCMQGLKGIGSAALNRLSDRAARQEAVT